MKVINLEQDLEGHIVLWAKGWYGEEHTLERLYEIQRERSGLSELWVPFVRDTLQYVIRTAEVLQVPHQSISRNILFRTAVENKATVSYWLRTDSKISLEYLIMAYADAIADMPVNDRGIFLRLPNLLPGLRGRYQLKDRGEIV